MRYIRYFLYVGINWGWKIACVIIFQETRGEKKYGIHTTGADELSHLKKAGVDITHATVYMPVSYELLEQTLEQIPLQNRRHFLDIGCGKGRAICVAAHYGFTRVTGIDFSAKFCLEAKQNIRHTQQKLGSLQATVLHEDAREYSIPADADCIFLFNPFDEVVMKTVVSNIQQSIRNTPREVNVLYANPLYQPLFEKAGFRQTYYSKKLEQFEVSILNCRP